jgi:apolipoprotein D and lipocalin family protein
VPAPSFRDGAVPIASAALFDPARFAGTWHRIARTPSAAAPACAAPQEDWTADGTGGFRILSRCGAAPSGPAVTARAAGPGRFALDDGRSLWVLWVDEGYRTAVLGAPDGSEALILDRRPTIPADRWAAAQVMLDFNGFDPGRLVRTAPLAP